MADAVGQGQVRQHRRPPEHLPRVLVAGLRRPVHLVHQPAADPEAAVLQPVLLLQSDNGRSDQPGGVGGRHQSRGRRAAVPDHAGGELPAGAGRCAVQRQLPVRDAHLVHRVQGQPGLCERGLYLHPQAHRHLTVYVARRIATAILVVAGVVVLTFVIARVVPGDPAATWAGPHASAAQIAAARRFLGLDRPPAVQLASYFGGILTGNWGVAIHTHRPVLSDIGQAAPASIELVTAAMIIGLVVAVPLALILQLVLSDRLHLLPAAGEFSPGLLFSHPLRKVTGFGLIDAPLTGNWPMFGSQLGHLLLPALVVAAYPAGLLTRMIRAQVLDTVGDTHVQMVRALGFRERSVYGRFAMKLAWNPVTTTLALVFGYSLVNTFLVEAIFDWPGLGEYANASITALDTPAILGVTLFVALVYVGANLVVDLVQAAIDPRIRLR